MKRTFAFLGLLAAASATTGCGDDGGDETTTVPLGPPAVAITVPEPGACLELDENNAVRVKIVLQNWSLRPPGYCGGIYQQCGFAVFFADGQEVARSASLVTNLSLAALASPAGSHTVRVELRNDADEVQLDREGEPLVAEVEFSALESCP